MSDPAVINQPLVNKSDTVTVPDMGEQEVVTGFARSVITDGRNPTNNISQVLPEAVNPKVNGGVPGAAGSEYGAESAVIPTPGA